MGERSIAIVRMAHQAKILKTKPLVLGIASPDFTTKLGACLGDYLDGLQI
jgi:hypothetical protein